MTKKCHFIGIGGIGMSGLARIMLDQQCSVSGSDLSTNYSTEGLSKKGAKIFLGHSVDHIPSDATVVYSSDIKQDNPEYQAALALQCKLLHRSDLLVELSSSFKTLAVTGTHGKTTTSALLAAVLLQAGLDPSFAIGGILPQLQVNAGAGKGEFFVIEADESDGTFLKYKPFGAIVTNIDLDHMNHYLTEENLLRSFITFMHNTTTKLFWCGDDSRLATLQPKGISYGFSEVCELRVSNFKQEGWRSFFTINFAGKTYESIELGLVGEHNALNAAAVFGLALSLDAPEEAIRSAFRSFGGVLRRCEKKGERQGILLLDDYAHHPVEIGVTLKGVRSAVGDKRVIAVYQPHRYSRTRDCLGSFSEVFDDADEVIITDIFSAGEEALPGVTPQSILEEVKGRYIPRKDLAATLARELVPHDVLISLGAGDITKLASEVLALNAGPKLRLGLVFGGRSTEHEVSLRSAQYVAHSLNPDYYDVTYLGITKEGKWLEGQALLNETALSSTDSSAPISQKILEQILGCDLLFPVLHGPFGEDGTIQGFFEMLGKAYVGCDSCASAIAMDKAFTKKLALAQDIPIIPFVEFSIYEWRKSKGTLLAQIEKQLTYPLFVKPVHLGSSVGIRKVSNPEELLKAILYAFLHDTKIVIENGVDAREIEFSVLGNGIVHAFPPGEICSSGQVYDYESKYGPDAAKTHTQAELPQELIQEGVSLAKKAYNAIGCTGMARVDFFLDREGKFWLNEINPIPGFTAISLYPKMCEANGVSGKELIDRLVILGLERKRRRRCMENI